ncbi:MAG: hypothetical protein ACP5QO_16485 [Clostridia bacterium]
MAQVLHVPADAGVCPLEAVSWGVCEDRIRSQGAFSFSTKTARSSIHPVEPAVFGAVDNLDDMRGG